MKRLFLFCCIAYSISSCKTAKDFPAFIQAKSNDLEKEQRSEPWLDIKCLAELPATITCEQLKKSVIPALLYWGWNYTTECEIDLATRLEYINRGIFKAAESVELKEQLGGRKLHLTLTSVPGKFLYENIGTVVVVIVAYFTTGAEIISPYPVDLNYDYVLMDGDTVLFEGKGAVLNMEQPIRNIWKSTKKFTWAYLEEYEKAADRMGLELISNLVPKIPELQTEQ